MSADIYEKIMSDLEFDRDILRSLASATAPVDGVRL